MRALESCFVYWRAGGERGVFAPGEVARVSGARYKDMTRVLEGNIDILRAPGKTL